jgi:hypothetical protein
MTDLANGAPSDLNKFDLPPAKKKGVALLQ